MVKWILLSALTLLGIAITPYDHLRSQDDQSPRFGRVAYLGTPDIEYSSFTLSPDGRILVANASRLLPVDAGTGEERRCCIGRDVQQVWYLSDEGNWQAAIFNPPNATYQWVGEPDKQYEQVDTLETALSFSPDGRYLAVRTFEEIQIRSAPKFGVVIEQYYATPTDSIYVRGDAQVAWSTDSRFLAYLERQVLRVLEIATGESVSTIVQTPNPVLIATEFGWIVYWSDGSQDDIPAEFTACLLNLMECARYQTTARGLALFEFASQSSEVLVLDTLEGRNSESIAEFSRWISLGGVHFEEEALTVTFPDLTDYCIPMQFNSNETRLLFKCVGEQLVDDPLETLHIFNYPSMTQPRILTIDDPIWTAGWLMGDDHIYVYDDYHDVVRLHDTTEDREIDDVNLNQLHPHVGEHDDVLPAIPLFLETEGLLVMQQASHLVAIEILYP